MTGDAVHHTPPLPPLDRVVLLVIDGMDTINFTMGRTPNMSGLHVKAAMGVARTDVLGAGTTITPTAHGMMGAGRNVTADRPGPETDGRPYTYDGRKAFTIGHVARQNGCMTAAVGKDEVAISLGGIDNLDISSLQRDGLNSGNWREVADEIVQVLGRMERGILAANYNAVDVAGHNMDVRDLIEAVENADRLAREVVQTMDTARNMLIICADHGTDPMSGSHNMSPTPLSIITQSIGQRRNIGIVHNLEIAPTILGALGLPRPQGMMGRDLLRLAISGGHLPSGYDPNFFRHYDD